MILVKERLAEGGADPAAEAARLTLPFELRRRSRLRTRLDDGREVALVLDRGTVLRGGTRLRSENGLMIEVAAGAEPVSVVRTDDPGTLARAAYHLGNRHVALEVGRGELRYLADHVLDDMLGRLGVAVVHEELPFEPEDGAYRRHRHPDPAA